MKEISSLKRFLADGFSQKYCDLSSTDYCKKDGCECLVLAEIQALIATIIPLGFRNYSIHDFTGLNKRYERLLNPADVRKAREQIVNYCYSGVQESELRNIAHQNLNAKSIIGKRVRTGQSVVIHGAPGRYVERDRVGDKRMKETQVGRTMVASILTKEAIKLRANPKFCDLTYDWIDYSILLNSLKNDYNSDYQFCDWLVIDNITTSSFAKSEKQKAFEKDFLDPFFFTRASKNLPTILVCKFDINEQSEKIEESFGVAMSKLMNSSRTTIIHLPGRYENDE